jgi:acetyltransferase-like isoleucine patch superfamily enzyme
MMRVDGRTGDVGAERQERSGASQASTARAILRTLHTKGARARDAAILVLPRAICSRAPRPDGSVPALASVVEHRLRRYVAEFRSVADVFRPRLWFWSACAALLPDFSLVGLRGFCFRNAGCDIGPRVALLGRIRLVGSGAIAARLHMKEGCVIAPGVTFGLDSDIHLGRNVSLSPGVVLYTGTHVIGFGSMRMLPLVDRRPIAIQDGSWIGMQALLLPGVTVGHGSVVSAGAVLTVSVPPNSLVSGNPATVQAALPFGDR